MHGRQKKHETPEEQEKKEKERQEKLVKYKTAMSKVFQKRKEGSLDQEMLAITGKVLSANPDIGTLWNIRKEVLLDLKIKDETAFEKSVSGELQFIEACLTHNPKSYGAWHHRYWIMIQTDFKLVEDEIKLCSKYLQYDDRNFHCWDYRKFLVDHCDKVTPKEELDFTTNKIQSNFSNYSSWHFRSKVLPKTSEDFLNDELDLVKNAAFTDPNDQSVWFYHKWLVNAHLQKGETKLLYAAYLKDHGNLLFTFDVRCPAEAESPFALKADEETIVPLKAAWSNAFNKPKSKLWSLNLTSLQSINVVEVVENSSLGIPGFKLEKGTHLVLDKNEESNANQVLKFLSQEKEWIEELYDLEPENKWLILSLIHLLRLIDFENYKDDIFAKLDKLIHLDVMRKNYYCDLKRNFNLESTLKQELQLNRCSLSHILPPF